MAKSLYDILGVDPGADPEQIRAAHDALLARCPENDTTRRLALKEALGTLGHPQRRATYDASMRAANRRAAAVPVAEPAEGPPWRLILIGGVLVVGLGAWFMRLGKPPNRPAVVSMPSIVVPEVQQDAPARTAAGSNGDAPAATAPTVSIAAPGTILSPEALFNQASASIVRINAELDARTGSVGSGVVVGRGVVVTNCHVTGGASHVKVRHGNDSHDGTVIVADGAHDLCKLSVPSLDAPAVSMADSSTLNVGQKVYAIGSPQGLDLTLSDGLVSALRQGPDGTFIQTTAPVSPGSSGGGLFAADGRLVGIVTFQMRSGQNLNFAVPAEWIDRMQNTESLRDTPPPPNAAAAMRPEAQLTGAPWTCYGPLTGRGLTYQFLEGGGLTGMHDGKPISGRYLFNGKMLSILGGGTLNLQVEELGAGRMVLNAGQGRRIVCNR